MAARGPSLKVNGMPELFARLREMASPKTMETIAYKGTFGASKDLRKEITSQLLITHSVDTGAILRNVAQKKVRSKGTLLGYTVGIRAGTRRQQKQEDNNPWYWWLLEFGTRYIAPRSFFRTAWIRYQATAKDQVLKQAMDAVFKAAATATKRHRSPTARGSNASMSSRQVG